ncbi:preprotein translocase subunit YajC [Nocardioides rotundus]|uniref:preprotein translocase subunit YajC n=1 Tax=Nocardioides rotundus TaxID=1774216 RepID=UPI001CBF2A59|nr:preprotein translocase subunit YajC [Nocardioides rotundus]UAL31275.1 preprotein translocase subunit YajC [Nocardioides rotundus]
MQQFASLLPLILVVLVFWLLVIRPASKRQKAQRELQQAVGAGDRVMLTSGIFGTVRGVLDDRLEVEIANGVVVQVARQAIATRVDATPTEPGGIEPGRTEPDRPDDDTPPQAPPTHGNI